MQDSIQKTFKIYFTSEGKRTCSPSPKDNCVFLRFTHFGSTPCCVLQDKKEYLDRDNEGRGYIVPHSDCFLTN